MGYPLEKLLDSQELAQKGVIFASASFRLASPSELIRICNGCGADGSFFRPPETIYGTWIAPACIIHDFDYHMGQTHEDKEEADRVFKNNMQRLIFRDAHIWWKPTRLQLFRANIYYLAVVEKGGPAFWVGKNHY